MRSAGSIRHKLKQVVFRHVQKEIRDAFKQTPEGCFYNQAQNLKGLGPVHLCQYRGEDGKPRKMLCDSRQWNGTDQARNCSLWAPKRDKEQIKAEMKALLASGNLGQIAARFPDVAALMWVLGQTPDDVSWDDLDVEAEPEGTLVQLQVPDPVGTPNE